MTASGTGIRISGCGKRLWLQRIREAGCLAVDAAELCMSHKRLYDLQIRGQLRDGTACVYGIQYAARIREVLEKRLGHKLPFGELDINLYRDDWTTLDSKPVIGPTNIPFDLSQYEVLLVDDVLFTGRTVRAALEALGDHGRPQKVELLALIDRGHRELPIQADFVGKVVQTIRNDHVDVAVAEIDGNDEVILSQK